MSIPDFQSVMRPILVILLDGMPRSNRQVIDKLSDEFELTDFERADLLPSGTQRTMANRVQWSLSHLFQAGLIERPQRGHVRITDSGREVLGRHSERVDMSVLRSFPSYREFRERSRMKKPLQPSTASLEGAQVESASPEDLLISAIAENRAAVEGDVLRRALALSPTGFEDLVIRLLDRMGYGRAGSAERTSATGDAGIDGIISQDPLGLDRIYVQAKRYAVQQVIHRPRIHEFAGALLGKQGDRGVYITTSSFSKGAREEAERINARIELIDGARLAELLVEYNVGVQTAQQAVLYRLDEDFFDTL